MISLPTLSTSGLITNNKLLMSRLFENFLRCSSKQSSIYTDYITSYKTISHLYNDDLEEITAKVEEGLLFMYGNYFNEVEIDVTFRRMGEQVYIIIVTGEMKDRSTGELLYLNENLEFNDDGY